MCNYCSNTIVFYGKDKSKLSVLLRKLDAAFNSRGSQFYNFMVLHGYGNREISAVIDKRDFFTSCDTKLSVKEDTYSFRLDTETAWEPHMEIFRKVLQEKYGNVIRMVYMAEECGSSIFINSDTEGKFLQERYMVDCCHNGEYHKEYFDSYQETVEWLRGEYLEIGFGKYDTIADIEEKVNRSVFREDDDFFYLHRFEPDYSYLVERSVA